MVMLLRSWFNVKKQYLAHIYADNASYVILLNDYCSSIVCSTTIEAYIV